MLHDVQAQDVTITAGIGLQLVNGPVGAFAHPVGVAVGVELGFKERLNEVAQSVMGNPIPERGRADEPPFGFVDDKVLVGTGLVRPLRQLILQR